jgi:uncharacterized surface protein with fasciclin (FAS1) repeats
VLALVVLAVLPSTFGQSCNTNLLAALANNPNLSQLVAVISASGLNDTVTKLDNATVLAPTNSAVAALNSILAANNLTLADVTGSGKDRAASILLYHIIPNKTATVSTLTNGMVLPTALGSNYTLTVAKTTTATNTTVTFIGAANNATVISGGADNKVCNSIVHIVNAVLLPSATLGQIPIYNGTSSAPGSSGAAALTIGAWGFGLSAAVATAMLM